MTLTEEEHKQQAQPTQQGQSSSSMSTLSTQSTLSTSATPLIEEKKESKEEKKAAVSVALDDSSRLDDKEIKLIDKRKVAHVVTRKQAKISKLIKTSLESGLLVVCC